MPKVAKGRRQRAYHRKTRTGCLTCRKRRVKCDEAWPACLRCTSSGRSIQGHHAIAGAHIRSGAKLLREISYHPRKGVIHHDVLGSKGDGDCYVSLEAISSMYARMCPDINLIVGPNKFKFHERLFSDDVPLTFNSVEDAKVIFEYCRAMFISSHAALQLSSSSVDLPAFAEPDTGLFETLMSKYSLALQAYIKSKSPYFTPVEDIAMAVLQLHVLGSYLSIYIEHSPPDKKANWKDFMPQVNEMLELSEKVLSSTSPGNNRGPTTFFCLDMGIVLPLYTLASQCGDPTIRRKVITLLRSTARQEAFWNSFLVANAIERIMEAEENVSGGRNECTDGANDARPVSVEPFLGLDGNGGWLRHVLRGEL
ncbi:hypothetical protein OIDMADRAFT_109168 [Oidiodendron maius Zn]|uniref:Zn(2)-C6 fungal-type domain-containing protein n=1 Tax=Oidiodendron maius (strain Zn) TaxID=913774 RepID=A0A0C3DCB6_OIDMZ|nr:hypothetical protein OIDMADRAFT_109168 [Oidiodendron maius Zn]